MAENKPQSTFTCPVLDTKRLVLRRIDLGDAAALMPIYSDVAVMQRYRKDPCDSVEACRRLIDHMLGAERTSVGYRWSIVLCRTHKVIGSVGYHGWDIKQRTAKLSYELVPTYRGLGYATEAAETVLLFGFKSLNLNRVEVEIHLVNVPSLNVAFRLGFTTGTSDNTLTQLVMNRRTFMQRAVAGGLGLTAVRPIMSCLPSVNQPLFHISLAPWSLIRAPYGYPDFEGIDLLDYPAVARELGFDAIEYDNLHFPGDLPDEKLITQMKQRCDDEGMISTLILCGQLGDLADTVADERSYAIHNYAAWMDAAVLLECHAIRVVCADVKTVPVDEKLKYAVEGVSELAEIATDKGVDLLIENHNGYTSDPNWLVSLIQQVGHPRCGILADFTNWQTDRDPAIYWPDSYDGIHILAPYTRSVSAKAAEFDDAGNETTTDFFRMMHILVQAGFYGYAAVEYFGDQRREGSRSARKLLEHVRMKLSETLDN